MARKRSRRGFGRIRRLPSKRYQANYVGPDLQRHNAPTTFETREDAEWWLANERRLRDSEDWTPPATRGRYRRDADTLATWAPEAIERRRTRGQPLQPRTVELYQSQLHRLILPGLGNVPMREITPERVAHWYDRLDATRPTQRAHAYSLLRTLLGQAVDERVIPSNPAQVRGAGRATRASRTEVATPAELVSIADAMPEHLRTAVLLAGWCALRFGELTELRRRDIDLPRQAVKVERAVVRVGQRYQVGAPKSEAGRRQVAIPPHLLPLIEEHLARHVGRRADALLFPSANGNNEHMGHAELMAHYYRARGAAGRADLRWHDLRHTAAVLAAQSGATLAELMARLGHSTPSAALRYQHAAQGRDAQIAARLSELAGGGGDG